MRTSFVKRALCIGLGVAAAATAASPAMAASPFLRDTSVCPTGKVVVGGGSQVVGEGTADFKTFLQESAPGTIGGGAQSLWLTALRNSDTKQHKVGLFAVCATKPVGYEVVRKDTAVPAGGFVRTTANCPVGKVVLAGGAQVVGEGSAEFRTRVQESAPGTIGGGAQSVWLAAVRNSASTRTRSASSPSARASRPATRSFARTPPSRPAASCARPRTALPGWSSTAAARA